MPTRAERYGQIALGDPVAVEKDVELPMGSGLLVWHERHLLLHLRQVDLVDLT